MQLCFEDKIILIHKDDASKFTHLAECLLLNDGPNIEPVHIPYPWPNVGTKGTMFDLVFPTTCDSTACSLVVNILTYLHPTNVSVLNHWLEYIAHHSSGGYISSLRIDKVHLMYIINYRMKLSTKDKYKLGVSDFELGHYIFISLYHYYFGYTRLCDLTFPTHKDMISCEYEFKYDQIRDLLKEWLPNDPNGGDHIINYKYNRSKKTNTVTFSIGSYTKEINIDTDGKYDLHDHIFDYIKMHI